MYRSSRYAKTVFEIVHEKSFLHAEPVKPPPPLHLRLLAAIAELAVYVFREHHAGAVLLFSVRTLPFFKPNSVLFFTEYQYYEKEHTARF